MEMAGPQLRFARLATGEFCLRRHGFAWAISPGRVPGFSRLYTLGSGTVDGGGMSGLTPGTAVGEVEELLHTGPPLLVDLGVVGAGWELDQSLGGDEGVVTGLRVLRKESAGLALGALLALASAGTIALFTDSGILASVAANALLHTTIFTAPGWAASPAWSVLLRRWRRRRPVCRSSATLAGGLRARGGDRFGRLDVGPLLRSHGR